MADVPPPPQPPTSEELRVVALTTLASLRSRTNSISWLRVTNPDNLSSNGQALRVEAGDAADGVAFLLRLVGPGLAPLRGFLAAASLRASMDDALDYSLKPQGLLEEANQEEAEATAKALAIAAAGKAAAASEVSAVSSTSRRAAPEVEEVILPASVMLARRFSRSPTGPRAPGVGRAANTDEVLAASLGAPLARSDGSGAYGVGRAANTDEVLAASLRALLARSDGSGAFGVGRAANTDEVLVASLGALLARSDGSGAYGVGRAANTDEVLVASLGALLARSDGNGAFGVGRAANTDEVLAASLGAPLARSDGSGASGVGRAANTDEVLAASPRAPLARDTGGDTVSRDALGSPEAWRSGGGHSAGGAPSLVPGMPPPPQHLLSQGRSSVLTGSVEEAELAMEFIAKAVDNQEPITTYAVWDALAGSNLATCFGLVIVAGRARLCLEAADEAKGFCGDCWAAGSGGLGATTSSLRDGRLMPFPNDETFSVYSVRLGPKLPPLIGTPGALAAYRAWCGTDTKAATKHALSPTAIAALRSPDTGGSAIYLGAVNPAGSLLRFPSKLLFGAITVFSRMQMLAPSSVGGPMMGEIIPLHPLNIIIPTVALRGRSQRFLSAITFAPAFGSPLDPAKVIGSALRIGGLNSIAGAGILLPWRLPFFSANAGPMAEADARALEAINREDPNRLRNGNASLLYQAGGIFVASPLDIDAAARSWRALIGLGHSSMDPASGIPSAWISEVLTVDAEASGRPPEDLAAVLGRYAPIRLAQVVGQRFFEFSDALIRRAGTSMDAVAAAKQLVTYRGRVADATGILDIELPPENADPTYTNVMPTALDLVAVIPKDARTGSRGRAITAGRAASVEVVLKFVFAGTFTRVTQGLLDEAHARHFGTQSASRQSDALARATVASAAQVFGVGREVAPLEVPPAISELATESSRMVPTMSAMRKRTRRSRSNSLGKGLDSHAVSEAASIDESRNVSRAASPTPRVKFVPKELTEEQRQFIATLSVHPGLVTEATRHITRGYFPVSASLGVDGWPLPAYVMFPHATAKPPIGDTSFCRICVGPHETKACPRNTPALEAVWSPLGRAALKGPRQSRSMVFPK
jgi:hypothetical protein